MSLEMGALPGTIRTASVILTLDEIAVGATGIATVSLADVKFNEVDDAPAQFSLLWLHVGREPGIRLELCAQSDTIESWPRWTIRREVSIQVWNLDDVAQVARVVPLLLQGFPPAPTPKTAKFSRLPALPVLNTGSGATATDNLGLPLACEWRLL